MEHFLKKGTYELKLCLFIIWQLTQSGQFPTHQFGISISILCFKSIGFIKKPDLARLILYNKNNFSTVEKEHLKKALT